MKKRFLLILALFMSLSVVTVRAEEAKAALSGTIRTNVNNLLISTYMVAGNGYDSVTGTISYDKSVLAFYQYEDLSPSKWKLEVDTSKAGTIKFTATMGSNPILITNDQEIIKITFIVIATEEMETTIAAKSAKATYTVTEDKEVEDKDNIINQAEIEEAKRRIEAGEEGVVVPDPIYGTKIIQVQSTKTDKLPDCDQKVKITKHQSSDSYLRNLVASKGTLNPAFSKSTNAYRLVIDPSDEFTISCETEDPKASYSIEREINNQVVINVMAEDGSSNAYVITIIRQTDYNSTDNPVNPGGSNPINPSTPTPTNTGDRISLDIVEWMITGGMGMIALAGFIFGGRLIHLGSHNR
ncbi:MAG: hypothetical protein IJM79_07600 [Erysipelotrichaceae bacterium]|nr:hypothetical protein [Erysipelotrichaceae bacterium]